MLIDKQFLLDPKMAWFDFELSLIHILNQLMRACAPGLALVLPLSVQIQTPSDVRPQTPVTAAFNIWMAYVVRPRFRLRKNSVCFVDIFRVST